MRDVNEPRRRIRGTSPVVQSQAKDLRQTATPAEKLLWEAIRDRNLNGVKFRRQHAVGRFIADFFSSEHKLVIELDGAIHDTANAIEYDKERSEVFAQHGYQVVRFRNEEVLTDLSTVLVKVTKKLNL